MGSSPHLPAAGALRRRALASFIVFLSLSALIAIITVLAGSWSWFELRVLITTSLIAAASICCMVCALYAEKTDRRAGAAAGAALNITGAALLIFGAWVDPHSDTFWKAAIAIGVFGVAAAHYFLLGFMGLRPGHRWIQHTALAVIAANAAMIVLAVITDSNEHLVFKIIAVLSILAALATLAIPVLARIDRPPAGAPLDRLVLIRVADGVYRTDDNRFFRLEAVNPPAGPSVSSSALI
jgi:hypothetical protein